MYLPGVRGLRQALINPRIRPLGPKKCANCHGRRIRRCGKGGTTGIHSEGSGFVNDSDNVDATLINENNEFVSESDGENAQEVTLRDPAVFPVCVTDEDCENMTSQHNYRCFMGRNLNMQTEKLWKKSKIRGW